MDKKFEGLSAAFKSLAINQEKSEDISDFNEVRDEIIERYKALTIDSYILPIYSEPHYDYSRCLRTYNKRLERISGMLNLKKPLSSYVSRHSWATIALRRGISVQVISEGMGHENEKTTRIYLASLEQSVIDSANARIIAL